MNSALRSQILADRRRDLRNQILAERSRERRNDILASVIGWTVTIVGAIIGTALFYAFTFTFLLLGV